MKGIMINFIRASRKGYISGLIILAIAALLAGCATQAKTVKQNQPAAPENENSVATQTPGYKFEREPYFDRDFEGDMEYSTPVPQSSSANLTKATFAKIKTGMSLEEVENLLGDKGMLVSTMDFNGRKTKIYKWSSDNFTRYIDVTTENEKVIEKKEKGLK